MITQDTVLKKAKTDFVSFHGTKYKVNKTYVRRSEQTGQCKLCGLVCAKHGKFECYTRRSSLERGCVKCSRERHSEDSLSTRKRRWLSKCKKVHGNTYDYSKVVYVGSGKKVTLICRMHGSFTQSPIAHARGFGCKECGRERNKDTTVSFLRKAKIVHGSQYTYKKSIYKHSQIKVCISCKYHGDFWQTPNMHLTGQGCPSCKTLNINFYSAKSYTLGNRKVIVQGYEPQALDYLQKIKGLKPNELLVGRELPVIIYKDPVTNKNRKHFPDIYIPNQNRLVEVKSVFTLFNNLLITKRKREAAIKSGYKYSLIVVHSTGEVMLPTRWHLLSETSLRKALLVKKICAR